MHHTTKRPVVFLVVCLSILLIGLAIAVPTVTAAPSGTTTTTATPTENDNTESNSTTTTTSTSTPTETPESNSDDAQSLSRDKVIQWAITSQDVSDERAQRVQQWFQNNKDSLSERDQRIISRWLDVQIPSDNEEQQNSSIEKSNLTNLDATYLGGQVEIYDENWKGTTYEAVVCTDETMRIAVTDSSNIGRGSGSGSAQIDRYTIESGCEKISMVTNPTGDTATVTIGFGGPRLHYNNNRLGGGPLVKGPFSGDSMQTVAILSTSTGVLGVLGIVYRKKKKLKWAVKRP